MNISDLEFYAVEIGSAGQEPPVRSLVVRLATDSGLEGWGEAQAPWLPAELPARRNALLPALAGRSVFDIEELLCLAALRLAPLRSAVEMASWDVIARAAGQPLCHLFGGSYRRRAPLAVRLSGGTPERIARLSRELAEQGFHHQIVPSSGVAAKDLETFAALRHMLPERTQFQFDGAARYDFPTAWDLCNRLEGEPLQFFLDPLQTPDFEQTASLRRQTSVPLAVRRTLRSPADMLALVRAGAAPTAVVDLHLVGGMVAARKCAAIGLAAGIQLSLVAAPSLGIGLAAMLQLAAALPAYSGCHECVQPRLEDDLLVEPLEVVGGMIAVPQGPGLGIEVDRGKIERYQVT